MLTLTGEDIPDECRVGMTAAVQIAGHGTGIVGYGTVLSGQASTAAVLKEQPAGSTRRPRHSGATGVEGADAADQAVGLIVGVAAHHHVGTAPGQQAAELPGGETGVNAGAIVGAG